MREQKVAVRFKENMLTHGPCMVDLHPDTLMQSMVSLDLKNKLLHMGGFTCK